MADKRVKIIKHNKTSVKFEVDSRYSPLESIGTGAYGVVCAAKDNRTGQRVAIKKIPKVFEVLVIAKRTYRELKILRHLRHENIISILDVMQPPDDLSQFEDVYVVLDLMESDLHHIIHSVQPLSDEHIKFFLYQVLRGLKYIHSANVLHRDLKPSNLLVNRNCELKIGDFGMARGLSSSPDEHATFMTEYVATRWYRAPELMLSFSEYTFAIDIWSVGCILAEMLARRQLFPGKDYLNQLQLILSVVGTPDAEYIEGVGSDRVKTYLQNLPARKRVDIAVLFPNCNSVVLDLLNNMLQLDPKKRITSEGALAHKYLTRYHDPKDEPICTPPFDFDFEKELITQDDLCKAIVVELMDYHKSRMPIPSQDKVKDALKKMMEDREKEREKVEKEIENGGSVAVKEVKEVKEVVAAGKKKNKGSSKKRKLVQGGQADLKRVKVEGEDDEVLTDKDRNTLSRWKEIQQHTKPFIHPIRKLVRPGDMTDAAYVQQQDLLIKQQFTEMEKQQNQILEYEKIIKDQGNLITTLREKHKAILVECQVAGVKLSNSLLEENAPPRHGSSSSQAPLPTSSQPIVSTSHSKAVLPPPQQTHLAPLRPPPPPPPTLPSSSSLPPPPASPANIFSPPLVQPAYHNISPTNRTPPPVAPPTSHTMLRPLPPPPPPLHPSVSIIALSSSCNADAIISSTYQQLPPASRVSRSHMVGLPPNHTQFHQSSHPMMMSGGTGHARNHMDRPVSLGQHPPPPFIGGGPGGKNIQSPALLIDDLTFSPLTSGELKELEQPGVGLMGSTYGPPPLIEDLDNILNLTVPSGSGAGYGVGVKEEDLSHTSLQIDLSNLGPVTSAGPPSASLLRDWLDVSQLDPDDMDVLQRELETGAPDVFSIQDFPDL